MFCLAFTDDALIYVLLQVFITRVGMPVDSSNATKVFKAVWRRVVGDAVAFKAHGVRFGAVMAIAATAPESQ